MVGASWEGFVIQNLLASAPWRSSAASCPDPSAASTPFAHCYEEDNEMTMFRRIDHIEITPVDFDRSISFYTDVLGFKGRSRITVDVHPIRDIIFLELGDTTLELLDIEGAADLPSDGPYVGYRMMAIEVENMDEALAYLEGKGVRASLEPRETGGGSRRAEIKDPDGFSIELRQL